MKKTKIIKIIEDIVWCVGVGFLVGSIACAPVHYGYVVVAAFCIVTLAILKFIFPPVHVKPPLTREQFRWIPWDSRRPEIGKRVLAHTVSGGYVVGKYDGTDFIVFNMKCEPVQAWTYFELHV